MKQIPRRLVYFVYYLKRLDWKLLGRFMGHVRQRKGWSTPAQWARILSASLRYNNSILEYYQFRFFEIPESEKTEWAGTGTMYEFQRRVNPPGERQVLNDKREFYKAYRDFCRHGLWTLKELQEEPLLVERILASHDKLVFKDATGNCGTSVRIVPSAELNAAGLTGWMRQNDYDMVESFIEQHPALQALSPSGVNTVRIFTLLDRDGNYHVLGCRLRISVDSPVDNMAVGNLAAPVDEATGQVNGPGVYSDITRKPETVHPVTGTPIEGFQLPYWPETLELVKAASLRHPQNRSIGWDVAITPEGPGLIEGNHDWCKLVWQLPVGRGLKPLLGLDA